MKPGGASGRFEKFWLALECAALFAGVPAEVALGWLPAPVIPLLLLAAAGCALALRWRYHSRLRDLWCGHAPRRQWRRVVIIYVAALPGLFCLLWAIQPEALFSLLHQHTRIWLVVMVAYPLLSVFPQELIYRAFFFERYRPLFGSGREMIWASAAVFSLGHLVFHNWPAILLTLIGGWLFAKTYQATSSLFLVCTEHALYGCAAFTLGYGQYFFDGTLRLVR